MPKMLPIVALGAVAPLLAACASSSGPAAGRPTIDGDLDDWRGNVITAATEDAIYFRFSPGEAATLQANDETTRLVFDLDNDPATGKPLPGPPDIGTLGVDLEIMMSPPVDALDPADAQRLRNRRAQRGEPDNPLTNGLAVIRHDRSGGITRLSHADVGFVAGPTYAQDWFEARLDRHAPALSGTGIDTAGDARALVLVTDGGGQVVRYSDPMPFVLPEAAGARAMFRGAIPTQPEGTIRVLSMNVLRGKPVAEPAPFARLIAAIRPDVILFQEADDLDADRLEAWLSGYVGALDGKQQWADGVQGLSGGVAAWDAAAIADAGVAIATPHVIAQTFDDTVWINHPETQDRRSVRAVFALISTPAGDLLACSTHLKCCGSAGSVEDLLRYAEAQAINERFGAIADSLAAGQGRAIDARIIGGDINLVGTRGPLDILGADLAADGTDLAPAPTPVIGGDAWYTWREDRSSFGPGRLDWILVGDARVAQSFALDTRLVDPASLAELGIEPGDGAASDHLPIVVDLRP